LQPRFELVEVVTKTAFSGLAGVSPGMVSRYLSDGTIGPEAIVGKGRNARIKAELALKMVRDRVDGRSMDGSLAANRARKEGLQADLLAFRLGQQRRAWEEEANGALRALFRAVGKAHEEIPGWAEEVVAAERASGQGAAAALLRVKSAELRHSIADLILAFKDEHSPDHDNGG
jgi:hypothetical protein